jgi:3-deoxy-7-phosphoheptulonate synthase
MQNYRLLKELGQLHRPVILRRGTANTVDELVSAAEYVLVEGNPNVILCEHGIRTFERLYELTVDFAAVPLLKERTHLPIVVDPSAAGRTNVVGALALAAAAAGADGIILEAEPRELDAYLDIVARATACAAALQGVRH